MISAFATVLLLAAAPDSTEIREVGGDQCAHTKLEAAAAAAKAGLLPLGGGDGGIAGFDDDTDVLHYDLTIEVDPATEWLGGTNTITVRSLVDNLTVFRVRIADYFTLTSVTSGGVPAVWTRIDPATIEITLDRPYNADEQFELFIAYNGFPIDQGFGSIVFTTHGLSQQPLVFTLSEPWYAYTWWPAKDVNTDKATGDLSITVPNTMNVASNGVLVSTADLPGNRRQFNWSTAYQMVPYLFSFGATNYTRFSGTWTYPSGSMPLEFFVYPERDTPGNRDGWLRTIPMLTTFSTLFGQYPFVSEKYGIYNFGFNGGMEHQTMTGQGGFGESLTAHELAHQWWGDMITCATWRDIWLNEGFATYCEALWYEFRPGNNGEQSLHEAMAARRPSSVNGSVYCYDDTNFSRIFSSNFSYRKGGWVLHMLRHVLGDEDFFETFALYRNAFEYRHAYTADFQDCAQVASDRDLDWFFQPWVYQVGAPDYQYAPRAFALNGRNYVELFLAQVQDAGWPTFVMPIDVVAQVGGSPATHVVWNDARSEHLLFETAGPASNVQLDPENWILAVNKTVVSWVNGPPKITRAVPGPHSRTPAADVPSIQIEFHRPVSVTPGLFSLTRFGGQAVPFQFAYSPAAQTVTLTPTASLTPTEYVLTVSELVTDDVTRIGLDGEIFSDPYHAYLPSGDGVAGGSATYQFTITLPRVAGDVNCDGAVNNFDIDPFVLVLTDVEAYRLAYPLCPESSADVNSDGAVNNFDIDAFVDLLTTG
jgi:hypothetical protein